MVSVDVTVENDDNNDYKISDRDSLVSTLDRIDNQLDKLKCFLNDDITNIDD